MQEVDRNGLSSLRDPLRSKPCSQWRWVGSVNQLRRLRTDPALLLLAIAEHDSSQHLVYPYLG